MLPWDNEPAKNISPSPIRGPRRANAREEREVVAKAKAHDVVAEMAELNSHTWPFGDAYDQASAFVDGYLSSTTNRIRSNHCSCNSSRSVAIV